MFSYETVLPLGRESERISTAFYRFIEVHGAPEGVTPSMRAERMGSLEKRTIQLWSEEALRSFETFVRTFQTTPPQGFQFEPRRTEQLA